MDGNGRWAKQRGLPRTKGHEAGEAVLFEVIEGAIHDAIRLPDTERAGEGWAQTVAALTEQLAVKDGQIASLGRALEAAQETAKAAQALHAGRIIARFTARDPER